MKTSFLNVAEFMTYQAQVQGDKVALLAKKKSWLNFFGIRNSKYETLTYNEIEKRINHYAHTFIDNGLKAGDKILVFIKPSLDFPIIIFSLFRAGVIPVFIDPGMGIESLLKCIEASHAKAIIGIPKIHHLRLLKGSHFSQIEHAFVVGGRAVNAVSFDLLLKKNSNVQIYETTVGVKDLAAILYTSGGTGTPKGVQYTHEMFIDQALKLKQMFKLAQQDRDYPCFVLFGLFSLALGLTVYMPEVELVKPAEVNAKVLCKALANHKITFATGSPALWRRVADYALKKKMQFPHLRSLATFGAPVNLDLHRDLKRILPQGEIYTPYGATECLPVSVISSHEILGETKVATLKGEGTCVGYPAPQTEIQILDTENNVFFEEPGIVGEILVASSTMTPGYEDVHTADQGIKYQCPRTQKIFHKMGDLGKLDHFGRLWFMGRKVQCYRIKGEWLCTEEIEPIVNNIPEVFRSALIQVQQKIVLVIERKDGKVDLPFHVQEKFFEQVKIALKNAPKGHLVDEMTLDHHFPVDTRHNIKIDRLKIAANLRHKGLSFI